jgi:phage protein D
MTEALLVSTAPVFQVDGKTEGQLARDILRLEIGETTAGLKTLTARFIGWGPVTGLEQEGQLYLDGKVIDFGKSIDVSIGASSDARMLFSGFISAIEGCFREGEEPEVAVFAEDKFMDLRMTRRFKTYENMSDAQIAEAIAEAHGLTAEADVDGPTYDVVQQWNVSDLAFLRERGRLIQAEVWFQDDTLHFKTRDKRTATEITLVQGNHLIDLQARADLAHQRTKVIVSGYDASDRNGLEEESGAEAIQSEISGGRTGPELLEQAFGERVSFRVREVPLVSSEATDWARAEMLRRCRSFVTVVGTTRGTPDMVVGSRVTLERVGVPFNGSDYYVTSVSHSYDLTNGHRTRFMAERATLQEAL